MNSDSGLSRRSRLLSLSFLIYTLTACSQPSGIDVASQESVPAEVRLQLVESEDLRRWDETSFANLFADPNATVRQRTALAAGRIGDPAAIPQLAQLLDSDPSENVAAMAAFAIGEIESAAGSDALLKALLGSRDVAVVARSVEALGKIAGALPEEDTESRKRIGDAILKALREQNLQPAPHREILLAALTAALRAKPMDAPAGVARLLDARDPRVRADALNVLARLRARESLDRIRTLAGDEDPVVRANAARALGAAQDTSSLQILTAGATDDPDGRVRAAAIRALAAVGQAGAADALLRHSEKLRANPQQASEVLEVATALGNLLKGTDHEAAVAFLQQIRTAGIVGTETEVAYAQISPERFLQDPLLKNRSLTAVEASSLAQGLGAIAPVAKSRGKAVGDLRALIQSANTPAAALPDALHALEAFKPADLASVARQHLKADDVIVRAAAADILAELPSSGETTKALVAALPDALGDTANDAALSIVAALGKTRDATATAALESALKSRDSLVRLRAAGILRTRPGVTIPTAATVNSRNTRNDYERAVSRIGKEVVATITTDRGAIAMQLLPDDAPLTVDSFVTLANAGFFNGLTFHRVVPNFVIQGGDPRGDGNGGPGYQIRCEINTVAYDRGAVGMALSGKDTGGSQFFITHSPQPHLDGGYTVFGRVIEGMSVVDAITRGDRIRSVRIVETAGAR